MLPLSASRRYCLRKRVMSCTADTYSPMMKPIHSPPGPSPRVKASR